MPMRPVLAGQPVADPRRGEIYEVNFDPAKGREQKGRRYCVVVSGDHMNASGLGTAIVCPMTTKERPKFLWRTRLDPTDVRVEDTTWQVATSFVETEQIVTLDVEDGRFLRHVGTVRSSAKMNEVTRWLYKILQP